VTMLANVRMTDLEPDVHPCQTRFDAPPVPRPERLRVCLRHGSSQDDPCRLASGHQTPKRKGHSPMANRAKTPKEACPK